MGTVAERKTAAGQSMEDYWRNAWQEAKTREEAWAKRAQGWLLVNKALKADLAAMTEERGRWEREAKKLRAKLVAFQDAESDLIDEGDEECEADEDGRCRSENHFDQSEHYTEM